MSNHCKCNFAISIVSEMLFMMLSILFIHFSFLRNQFMFKMKSDFNPIYPRSLRKRSWHVIHQIKSTHMDYLELKGFWNPSTYIREKWGVRCHTNFGTHCRFVAGDSRCKCQGYFRKTVVDTLLQLTGLTYI